MALNWLIVGSIMEPCWQLRNRIGSSQRFFMGSIWNHVILLSVLTMNYIIMRSVL